MKIKLMIFLAVASVGTVVGCGKPGGSADSGSSSTGSGSGGANVASVKSEVESKLKADPDLAAVKVSEMNGQIQLDGIVKDGATKDKADDIVDGILKAKNPTGGKLNNLQIKEALVTK